MKRDHRIFAPFTDADTVVASHNGIRLVADRASRSIMVEPSLTVVVSATHCAAKGIRDASLVSGKTATIAPLMINNKSVGLALSGGGFRATLFGLGSLWRLNELGLLRAIDRITAVSGGAILLGYLGARWSSLTFDGSGVLTDFTEQLVAPLREFCSRRIDVTAVLAGWASPFHSAGDIVAWLYDRHLFKGLTLRILPERPVCIIYATNMQTGRSFRFTRDYIADWHLGVNKREAIPLAHAVGASAAFPPLFSPVTLRTKPSDWTKPGSTAPNLAELQQKIRLADGGVYDNLGLEGLVGNTDIILVSDAGAPFEVTTSVWGDYVSQLARVRNVLIDQTRALRKRWLLAEMTAGRQLGTYWGISTEIGKYEVDTVVRDSGLTTRLQTIPTRLTKFTARDQVQLINWGYALCDAALRRHVLPGKPAAQCCPINDTRCDERLRPLASLDWRSTAHHTSQRVRSRRRRVRFRDRVASVGRELSPRTYHDRLR